MLNSRRWEDRFGALSGMQALVEASTQGATLTENEAVYEFSWKTFME